MSEKMVTVNKSAACGPSWTKSTEDMREKLEPLINPFSVRKVGQKIHDEMMHKTSSEVGPEPFKKGRFRNLPCPCGSGKKTKKCCGGE